MMKFKLKALVAALAMAAGSAFAAIPDGSTGNGGLFLEVYDGTGATYVRDLGITMNNFGTSERASGGFTANVDQGGATGVFANVGNGAVANGRLTFAADANFTSFLSGATIANLRWEVLAIDNTGTGNPDQLRILYTSAANDQTNAAAAGTLVNNNSLSLGIGGVQGAMADGVSGTNVLIGSNQSFVTTNPSDKAFATFLGNHLQGFAPNIDTFSTVGTDSFLTYATRSSSALGTTEAIFATYGTAANPFPVSLAADGTLTFGATVAAVPEPGTWAMLVAGLMMVGGIARRRTSV